MKTTELEAGKCYHRPTSSSNNMYYFVVGRGKLDDQIIVQSFRKSGGYESTFVVIHTSDWEEYDPTPEVSKFYNVYDPSCDAIHIGPGWRTLTEAKNHGNGGTWLGTVEVVAKGDKRVKTIWHGNI